MKRKCFILLFIVLILCSYSPIEPFFRTDENLEFSSVKHKYLNWHNNTISKKGTIFFYNGKKILVSNDLYLEFLYDYSRFTILNEEEIVSFYKEMHEPYKWSLFESEDTYMLKINVKRVHDYEVKTDLKQE